MRAGCAGLLVALLCVRGVAAQEISVSGDISVLSDYVDRGLSLSAEDPSAGGALYLDHASGLYGGLVLSRVGVPAGNDLELEGIAGWRTRVLDAYDLDLSVSFDSFHGDDSFGYTEIGARLSRDLGLFFAAAGVSYAPNGRWFRRNLDTVYSYLEIDVPIPDIPWLTATGHAGWEIFSGAENKADWGVGLAAGWRDVELSVGYEDSDSDADFGNARVVAALRYYF